MSWWIAAIAARGPCTWLSRLLSPCSDWLCGSLIPRIITGKNRMTPRMSQPPPLIIVVAGTRVCSGAIIWTTASIDTLQGDRCVAFPKTSVPRRHCGFPAVACALRRLCYPFATVQIKPPQPVCSCHTHTTVGCRHFGPAFGRFHCLCVPDSFNGRWPLAEVTFPCKTACCDLLTVALE